MHVDVAVARRCGACPASASRRSACQTFGPTKASTSSPWSCSNIITAPRVISFHSNVRQIPRSSSGVLCGYGQLKWPAGGSATAASCALGGAGDRVGGRRSSRPGGSRPGRAADGGGGSCRAAPPSVERPGGLLAGGWARSTAVGRRTSTWDPSGKPRPDGWNASVWVSSRRQWPGTCGEITGMCRSERLRLGSGERQRDRAVRGRAAAVCGRLGERLHALARREPAHAQRGGQPLPRARRRADGDVPACWAPLATTPIGTVARGVANRSVRGPARRGAGRRRTGASNETVTGRPAGISSQRPRSSALGVVTWNVLCSSGRRASRPSRAGARSRSTVSCSPAGRACRGQSLRREAAIGTAFPRLVRDGDRRDVPA